MAAWPWLLWGYLSKSRGSVPGCLSLTSRGASPIIADALEQLGFLLGGFGPAPPSARGCHMPPQWSLLAGQPPGAFFRFFQPEVSAPASAAAGWGWGALVFWITCSRRPFPVIGWESCCAGGPLPVRAGSDPVDVGGARCLLSEGLRCQVVPQVPPLKAWPPGAGIGGVRVLSLGSGLSGAPSRALVGRTKQAHVVGSTRR